VSIGCRRCDQTAAHMSRPWPPSSWKDRCSFRPGPNERKARNLRRNTHCILTTGCNDFWDAFDVVVEGDAVRTTDDAKLERLADRFATKYQNTFGFRAGDGKFTFPEGVAYVFEVSPVKAFAYERAEPGGATRYRF